MSISKISNAGMWFFGGVITKGIMERRRRRKIKNESKRYRNDIAIKILNDIIDVYQYRIKSISDDENMVNIKETYEIVVDELKAKASVLRSS